MPILIICITFDGKMGVATTRAPLGLMPQHPTKQLAHLEDLLGQPLSWKVIFKISGLNPRYHYETLGE